VNSDFIAGQPFDSATPFAAAAASVAIVLDLLGAEPAGEAGESSGK
jgi:hypothetical protein